MTIYKTKTFARFARAEKLTDASLIEAVTRAERGLVDAELGGGLIKQRVARQGEGRRGGYRTLIALRAADRAVFLFGFAKNDRDNIDPSDLADLRDAAAAWLATDAGGISKALKEGILIEVKNDDQSQS